MSENGGGLFRRGRGVFAALLLLSVAIVGATYYLQAQALPEERSHAVARSKAVASEVDGALGTKDLDVPLSPSAERQLDDRVRHASNGEGIEIVRVWTPDGTLRFSTIQDDAAKADASALQRATKGDGHPATTVDEATDQMVTYFPMRAGASGGAFGAVEIVQPYSPIVESSKEPWLSIRQLAQVAALAMGLFLILSFVLGRSRKPDTAVAATAAGTAAFGKETKKSKGLSFGKAKKQKGEDGKETVAPATAVAKSGKRQPSNVDPNPSVMPDPKLADRLAKSEEGRKALEAEMDQMRVQLRTDNDRSTQEISQLREQLAKSQARVQEMQVAAGSTGGKDAPGIGPDASARVKELEQALEAEQAKAATAEARAKGLEAQLQRDGAQTAGSQETGALKAKLTEAEARATKAEALAADLQAHAQQLESKVMEAETRIADKGSAATAAGEEKVASVRAELDIAKARIEELSVFETRAAELEVEVKRLSSQSSSQATAPSDAGEGINADYVHEVEQELEQTQIRLRRAYADAENARAELTFARGGDAAGPDPALAKARKEVDRLNRELESALERAREAEDRAAGLQDAVIGGTAATTDPEHGNQEPSDESDADPESVSALSRNDVWSSVAPAESTTGGSNGTEPAEVDPAQATSLRSRLAKTAARKKPRNPSSSDSDWS